jgi:hypothetical protein
LLKNSGPVEAFLRPTVGTAESGAAEVVAVKAFEVRDLFVPWQPPLIVL